MIIARGGLWAASGASVGSANTENVASVCTDVVRTSSWIRGSRDVSIASVVGLGSRSGNMTVEIEAIVRVLD